MTCPIFDLSDPSWFPVDLHVEERRYGFLHIDSSVLERSAFLDTRIEAPLGEAVAVSAEALGQPAVRDTIGWLFHTSFCGSTLLARVLGVSPFTMSLREPMVLRRLGDARHLRQPLSGLVGQVAALLSRPWPSGGRVVVKPTHVALNIANDLLAETPGSRAIVITSELDDFLVSNLKKSRDSQAKIPHLAERAMQASGLHGRLPAAAFQPPDIACAAVLQWAAQRELIADIAACTGRERLRVLHMDELLLDLTAAAVEAAEWLALGIPPHVLAVRCASEGRRNAKATETSYGAAQRRDEAKLVQDTYSDVLARARAWADANVLPYMRAQARDRQSMT